MKKILVILVLSLSFNSAEAFFSPVTTVWEMNASATSGNVNGGGFDPANASFLTDLAVDAGTGNTSAPIVSSSYSFAAGDAGHWIYVKSGTNYYANCWFPISIVSAGKATLNATAGAYVCKYDNMNFPSPLWQVSTTTGIATVASPSTATYGLDYSQTTAARRTWAAAGGDFTNDLTCTDVTNSVCTSASYNFQAIDVGNYIHVTAGTAATTTTTGALWAEIQSVSANAATLDHNITSHAGSALTGATARLGGAISLNSTLDDDFFEAGGGTNGTGAMRFFMKNGNFSLGETVSIASSCGTQASCNIEGYNSLRGDAPLDTSRPNINFVANVLTLGSNWNLLYASTTGSGSPVLAYGTRSVVMGTKVTNTSTTAGRSAHSAANNQSQSINSEGISFRGNAFALSGNSHYLRGVYAHDSDIGLRFSGGAQTGAVTDSIIADNITAGISVVAASNGYSFDHLTLYGAENKLGTCLNIATGLVSYISLTNSIFYGCVTPFNSTDVQTAYLGDFNDYFNNTNTNTNMGEAAHDVKVNPSFVNVKQVTQTGTVTTSGAVLTDTGASFVTAGVTAGQDFLVMKTASTCTTPLTNTKVLITAVAATTLTVSTALSASGVCDTVTYQVTTGHNFAVGTNVRGVGNPGTFPALLTTGSLDIGAVQRGETSNYSSVIFNGTGVIR